jgi:superoxide dismutase, Cu-Zn family
MRCSVSIFIAVAFLTLSSCAPNSPSTEAQRARVADGARVELRDSKGKSVGVLTVAMNSGGGVQFTGHLIDLPPGPHGIHIHENGKCDPPDFESAGAHLNPSGKQHGGPHSPDAQHEGDIGNLTVKVNGMADVAFIAKNVTLTAGPASLLKKGGTSLVLHADPDDMKTDPSGNSGARIACGVITR